MANNDRKNEEKKKREEEKARLRSREEELVRERNEMLRNTDAGDRLREQQQQGPQGGLAASMHHPSRDVDMDRPVNVPSGELAGRHMPGAVSIHDTGVYPKDSPSSKAAPKGSKPGGHDMARPRDDRGRKQEQSRKRQNLKLQHGGGGPWSAQAPDMATSMVFKMADNATNFQDALPVNTSAGGGRQDHFQTPIGPNAVFHRARPEASYQVLKELAKRDPTNRGVVNNLSWTSNMESRKPLNKKYAAGSMKSLLANTESIKAPSNTAARRAAVDAPMGNTSDAPRAPASVPQGPQGLSVARCPAFDGSAGDDGLPFEDMASEVPKTPDPSTVSFVCPNCKLPGHSLATCVVARPLADGMAYVPGCPIHDSMDHSLDVCREMHKLSVDKRFAKFVVERQNMPSFHINWLDIVRAYYRQGAHTQRWEPMPWTPMFCRDVVNRNPDALMEAQRSRNLSTLPVDPASQTLRALFGVFPTMDWPQYLRAEFEPLSQTNAWGQIKAPTRRVTQRKAGASGNAN